MGALTLNVFLIFCIVSISLNGSNAARVLPMEKWLIKSQLLLLESLPRGPVPPSGPSSCTYIPGQGGPPCPLNEKHFAGRLRRGLVHAPPVESGGVMEKGSTS